MYEVQAVGAFKQYFIFGPVSRLRHAEPSPNSKALQLFRLRPPQSYASWRLISAWCEIVHALSVVHGCDLSDADIFGMVCLEVQGQQELQK